MLIYVDNNELKELYDIVNENKKSTKLLHKLKAEMEYYELNN